jgi:hypothetical protein
MKILWPKYAWFNNFQKKPVLGANLGVEKKIVK